jgi:hypothetical protein
MDHRQQADRWIDTKALPSVRRHQLLAIEFPRLADPAGHSPQEDQMAETVTQEWQQACDRMLRQWRDDVEQSQAALVDLGKSVADLSPDRQHVVRLLVTEDEALAHAIISLGMRIEKWRRFDDHAASRARGCMSLHLDADRDLADAVCDLVDTIRLSRQIGGAA